MSFDAYMKIEGIEGESTDKIHEKWIEVLSYSHGVSQAERWPDEEHGTRADHRLFSVTKKLDIASPKLASFCCSGKTFNKVTIELCRATDRKERYMTYTLHKAIIADVSTDGAAASFPAESLSFSYSKIEWNYVRWDQHGKQEGQSMTSWDLKQARG
jgi:type VI secretion system secreted protein Hcp